AYKYWHRMIFARFLAENHLLMHPDGVAVSLEECEELANSEGCSNGWELAARYASRMLPQIFPKDDVVLECDFATEHRLALEKLLAELPSETFRASDSLGWVYQFWQARRKEEVNKSGVKIGAKELPSVTQLFTEPYMVDFLLDNTLGAWWAGKVLTNEDLASATNEEELRKKASLPGVEWAYLRFVRESASEEQGDNEQTDNTNSPWRVAAGTFEGWPKSVAELKCLDPCMGSGHFIVAMFERLVVMRIVEEGISESDAIDAVIRDNLFGLEIDPRCTQIAAFNLALAAWKIVGFCELPSMQLACSGLGPNAAKEEWLALANGNEKLKAGMARLYERFEQGTVLGSLINPRSEEGDMFTASFGELQPLLIKSLSREIQDEATYELAVTAQGLVKAAEILTDTFDLIATNVPYLGAGKQDDLLKRHIEKHYGKGKADLATAFVLRCLEFCSHGGTGALVTPQNWLFLTTYTKLRNELLEKRQWNIIARLGAGAFDTISGHVVNVALPIITAITGGNEHLIVGIDVSSGTRSHDKAAMLCGQVPNSIGVMKQLIQQKNPDSRILFNVKSKGHLLQSFAYSYHGLTSGDMPRMKFCFWELAGPRETWIPFQSTVNESELFGGNEFLLRWEGGNGAINEIPGARKDGTAAWGKQGVLVSQMTDLPVTLYSGYAFDNNSAVIVPHDSAHLCAIWSFCSSPKFNESVRSIDQSLKVTNSTLIKVVFDLDHWKSVGDHEFPNGLPKPESDRPTQLLFHGRPDKSTSPIQVVVSRLLGYCWPAENDSKTRLSQRARQLVTSCHSLLQFADDDGIVCISAVRGENPAAERMVELLRAAYVDQWSESLIDKLLVEAGTKPGTTVEDWLRNSFFEQHCRLFHQRPFIWHLWDGRKDGFSCLVNYHKLDQKALESVTYSYLGDWITMQRSESNAGKPGADSRLKAAQDLQEKLKLILTGEPPYDIFVRWKPLAEQAIGWNPDLNDGVRMNIRPFVMAGVLRKNPNVKWTKDRGKEPQRPADEFPWFWKDGQFTGERINDVHLTLAEKIAARPEQVAANAGGSR
ncbi:MAG TPA: N-6 DNA methylase, partial [Pirellulaceae bacterium]|nr:N-6 DNA methylase [Pirellulaceae bacterium]